MLVYCYMEASYCLTSQPNHRFNPMQLTDMFRHVRKVWPLLPSLGAWLLWCYLTQLNGMHGNIKRRHKRWKNSVLNPCTCQQKRRQGSKVAWTPDLSRDGHSTCASLHYASQLNCNLLFDWPEYKKKAKMFTLAHEIPLRTESVKSYYRS